MHHILPNQGAHHQINIKPGLFGHVGETWQGQVVSQVYYDDEWNTLTSDSVLRCRGLDDCNVSRDVLIERLGVGLGATAAHELGHQGGLNFVTDIPCDSCYDSNTAASRAHFFQPLHWSDACLARMEKVLPGAVLISENGKKV